VGALIGLAVGDAIGTALEFTARDSAPPLTDMVGGGPFHLDCGEWTDDTAMALALAESLLRHPELNEQDLLGRFCEWWRRGAYSCTGACFDIGITTRQALERWERTRERHCGSTDPRAAGNGSLMRLAPVAIRFWDDRARLRDVAQRQSKTTHGAPEAVDACRAFAEVLADAIAGAPKGAVLAPRRGPYAGAIAGIMAGGWRGKARAEIGSSGYVAHSLEAALWCVDGTGDFRAAVLLAANLGDDADTTAAVTGQLAGALYGVAGIPATWTERLAWRDELCATAAQLAEAGMVR
jgi:ADP-ribosyl-[dinitrogen reductase] hydrolase